MQIGNDTINPIREATGCIGDLTYRGDKGSPLTYDEVDCNFKILNYFINNIKDTLPAPIFRKSDTVKIGESYTFKWILKINIDDQTKSDMLFQNANNVLFYISLKINNYAFTRNTSGNLVYIDIDRTNSNASHYHEYLIPVYVNSNANNFELIGPATYLDEYNKIYIDLEQLTGYKLSSSSIDIGSHIDIDVSYKDESIQMKDIYTYISLNRVTPN